MAVNSDAPMTELMPTSLAPFTKKYRSQWRRALIVSVAVNAVLVGGLAWSLLDQPVDVVSKPVQISVVSDSGAGGPAIAAPAPKTVAPPPPLSAETVEAIKQGIPVTEAIKREQPQPSTTSPAVATNSTASAPSSATASGATNATGVAGASQSDGGAGSDGLASGVNTGTGAGESGAGSGNAQGAPSEDTVTEPEFLGSRQLDGYSGSAVIGVNISADGTATSVWVISSSGDRGLVRAALNRARNGSYRPKTVNGEPVASTGVIHFGS